MEKFSRIAEDKLDDLAEDPNNIVYKYSEREPLAPEHVVPIETVRGSIKTLWDEVQLVRLKLNSSESKTLQLKKLVWWLKKNRQIQKGGNLFT